MKKNMDATSTPLEWLSQFFSFKDVFTLRSVTAMGMLLAISVVLGQFSLYITPTFKGITVAYLPGVVVGMLFGPWAALVFGFVADFIKWLIRPQGAYFIGYALSEMLSYFFYACMFFRQRKPIGMWRVVVARLAVLVLIVFGINYWWNVIQFGQPAGKYFTNVRLISNLGQFPFHAVLVLGVIKIVEKQNYFGFKGPGLRTDAKLKE